VFGGGDLADSFRIEAERHGDTAKVLSKESCDVRRFATVVTRIEQYRPDFVVCTAGMSDRIVGARLSEVVAVNLTGALHVAQAAEAYGIPCLLVASTAGIVPGLHAWYGAAKAGVITYVRSRGAQGSQMYAISPGRMDTAMRDADWPDEDPRTRVDPGVVAEVMYDIVLGRYAPGANVIVRKVGLERVDVYEEPVPCLPSLL
jgi:NAD(P)-dependent dehydrogenase (short-subunit alcohol dehydrogenase family)